MGNDDAGVSLERESEGFDASESKGDAATMDTPQRKQINTPLSKFEVGGLVSLSIYYYTDLTCVV